MDKWYSSLWESHLRATERHLPYGITQCYLRPNTGERVPPKPEPCRPVHNLPTLEGWKAKYWLYIEMVYLSAVVPVSTRSGTNQLIATRPGVEPTTSRSQRPMRSDVKLKVAKWLKWCIKFAKRTVCHLLVESQHCRRRPRTDC